MRLLRKFQPVPVLALCLALVFPNHLVRASDTHPEQTPPLEFEHWNLDATNLYRLLRVDQHLDSKDIVERIQLEVLPWLKHHPGAESLRYQRDARLVATILENSDLRQLYDYFLEALANRRLLKQEEKIKVEQKGAWADHLALFHAYLNANQRDQVMPQSLYDHLLRFDETLQALGITGFGPYMQSRLKRSSTQIGILHEIRRNWRSGAKGAATVGLVCGALLAAYGYGRYSSAVDPGLILPPPQAESLQPKVTDPKQAPDEVEAQAIGAEALEFFVQPTQP